MKKLTILLILFITCSLQAQQIPLIWNASPNATTNTTYRLYAHTNQTALINNVTNALVKVSTGTNLTVTITSIISGRWYFGATAFDSGIETKLSNIVAAEIPLPPGNLRIVLPPFESQASGDFIDTGYFRLKIGK